MDRMKLYVLSKSSEKKFALLEGNFISVHHGVTAFAAASYKGEKYTQDTGACVFLYEVEITSVGHFREARQVEYVSTKQV
jgi:hypothetical protein